MKKKNIMKERLNETKRLKGALRCHLALLRARRHPDVHWLGLASLLRLADRLLKPRNQLHVDTIGLTRAWRREMQSIKTLYGAKSGCISERDSGKNLMNL